MTQVHDPRSGAPVPQGHGPYAPAPHPAPGAYGPPAPLGYGDPGFGPPPARKRTGAIVGGVLTVLVLAALGVGAFLLLGSRVLDTAEAEREIAALTDEQFGVASTDVRCPDDVELAAGTVTTCTAQLQGQGLTFTVEQTDDEGNVQITSEQVLVPVTDVEALLTEQFATEAGLSVVSTCDAGERTVLVATAGLEITCEAALVDDPTDFAVLAAQIDAEGTVVFV